MKHKNKTNKAMKKIYFPLLIAILSTSWLGAQEPGENFAQPTNFYGRQINASNVITKEYEASFSYASDGKLQSFEFPEWGVSSGFHYEDDFLTIVLTQHDGMWPHYSDVLRYTYENGRIKTEAHEWDAMNASEYFRYEYYENGRLYKKYYADSNDPEDYFAYSTFEYENNYKTKIESYSGQGFIGTSLVWHIMHRTTSQYDDNYNLLSEHTDNYNEYGALTSSKRKNYTYTPDGQLETEVSQTLVEDNWENNTIHRYIYDEGGNLTEQQDGSWSTTLNDWDITKKTVHEHSQESMTYTVSFYKKSGDEWVWDIFTSQKIFFAPELKRQQEALKCFDYEDLFGSALINQFEFEMAYTKTPTYMSTKDKNTDIIQVYPNPGNDEITVKVPSENSVIRFYDLQGRLMLAKPFDFNISISTNNWSQGIYLWEIWNGTQKEAFGKWIKE